MTINAAQKTHEERCPLSQSQLGIYLECIKHKGEACYNLPFIFTLSKNVDLNRLAKAIEEVVHANTYLSVAINADDMGNIWQSTRKSLTYTQTIEEIQSINDVKTTLIQPFDLNNDRLFRFRLFSAPENNYFFFDIHHIIFDGYSFGVFMEEVNTAYNGEDILPKELTGFDVVIEEENCRASHVYEEAKLWHEENYGGVNVNSMPAKNRKDEAHGIEKITFSTKARKSDISAFCSARKIGKSVFFNAAFACFLSVYTNTPQVFFTTVYNGRKDVKFNKTFMMMVKTLAVCQDMSLFTTVNDLLYSVKSQLSEAKKHDAFSFVESCAKFGFTNELGFVYQGNLYAESMFCNEKKNIEYMHENGNGLAIQVYEANNTYSIICEFKRELYTTASMQELLARFDNVISEFLVKENLDDISLITDAEHNDLIALGQGQHIDYNHDETIIETILRNAETYADNVAVVDVCSQMSYKELANYSNNLANTLLSVGVQANDFVAVMLPRRKEFIVAQIGIMRAGAAYIPLDVEYPIDRLEYMLDDSKAQVLITTKDVYAQKQAEGNFIAETILYIEDIDADKMHASINVTSPEHNAYMIYTSGSTGKPKGVVIQHKALHSLIVAHSQLEEIDCNSNCALHINFSFDPTLSDSISPLYVGATLHIISEEMRYDLESFYHYLHAHKIDAMALPAQLGMELLNRYSDVPLKTLGLGGEKLLPTPKTATKVLNFYGPTEFTVTATAYEVQGHELDIPIGRPLANCECYIVDINGNLLPRGMSGDLCLSGVQIAKGYWQRENLTAEKFVQCKFVKDQTMYRTGDLVRWNDDGMLEYLGRIDSQVKLRGFRIELGEIEKQIMSYDDVTSVVVAVRKIGGVDHLCAYYTADVGIDTKALNEYLSQSLTEYMLPSAYIQLDTMPLTPNGKIDSKALPNPALALNEIVAPANAIETTLFAILSDIFGHSNFGVTNNLISLGLSSLLAIRLSVLLSKECGVKLNIKDIMKSPTIRDLAQCVASASGEEEIPVYEKRQYYPLAANQKGIYIDWELHKNTIQYNIPVILRFASIDSDKLETALHTVINNHHGLKARLALVDGEPVLERADSKELVIKRTKVEGTLAQQELQSKVLPFDLFTEDLARFEIVESHDAVYLFIDIHHIIFDGASVGVMLAELKSVYDGNTIEPEAFTPFDRALQEQELLNADHLQKLDAYFDALVAPSETSVYPHSANNLGTGSCTYATTIKGESIIPLVQNMGVTESNYFLTMTTQVLHRHLNEDVVQITMVSNGRGYSPLANTVGMFVKTLSVVSTLEKATIEDAVKKIQEQVLETISYDVYPFTRLVERHGIKAEIMFAFEQNSEAYLPFEDCAFVPFEADVAKFPVSINVSPKANGDYALRIEYDSALYNAVSIQNIATSIKNLAENVQSKDSMITDMSMLSDIEHEEIIALGQGEYLDYNSNETIIDAILRNAELYPSKTAVVDICSQIAYKDLANYSNNLALRLLELGVQANDFIAVMLPRRKEFSVVQVGIMRAGAAYIPLDVAYPIDRLEYMLKDSGAKILITTKDVYAQKQNEGDFAANTIMYIEDVDADIVHAPVNMTSPEHAAYMIYTSGSTGLPKGVVIQHKSLHMFVTWHSQLEKIDCNSNCALHFSFSFDGSFLDSIPPLFVGATLHIISEEMRYDLETFYNYLCEHKIDAMTLSTQLGMELLNRYDELPLHILALGGEKLLPMPKTNTRILNLYGPTEFTVASSAYELQGNELSIPIGRPVPNSESYIIDKNGNLLPRGMSGELCLSGVQIAKGYWQREDLTAEKFVQCKFAKDKTMYRTGDLARWNDDGMLEYLGRIDSQVKLRGFRIELGEIEKQIMSYDDVTSVVVAVRKIGGVDHLCAYYTADVDIDTKALNEYLSQSLTEYMLPSAYMQLEAMPLTPNGKIDSKALPNPVLALDEIVAPANAIEATLFAILSDIFGHSDFGVTNNLISLGLSSLLAIRLSVLVGKECGVKLNIKDIMQSPTIRDLAQCVASTSGEEEIPVYEKKQYYPLAANQNGIYIDWELHKNTIQYNIPVILRFASIDCDKLETALYTVINNHHGLKARLTLVDGEPVFERDDDKLLVIKRTKVDGTLAEQELQSKVLPFDLFAEDLARFEIIESRDTVYLFIDIHHIIFDGASVGVMLSELKSAYDGNAIEPEVFTSFDRSLQEQELLNAEHLQKLNAYFDALVASSETSVYPHSANGLSSGSCTYATIIKGEKIASLVQNMGVTESNYFLAMTTQVLHRHLNEDVVQLAIISNGRGYSPLVNTVGMFVKTLPVVSTLQKATVEDAVKKIQEQVLETINYDIYPFTRLVERHGVKAEIMFAFEQSNEAYVPFEDCTFVPFEADVAKLPVSITVSPKDSGDYALYIEYDSALYNELSMQNLATSIKNLSENVQSKDSMINEIPMLSQSEHKEVIALGQGEYLAYNSNETIIDVILRNTELYSDKTAVVDICSQMTYKELANYSNNLALRLLELGVQDNDFVAVMLPRRKEFSVVQLGIMRAGAAYIPMDLEYPVERLEYMLKDSRAKVLITTKEIYAQKQNEGDFAANNIIYIEDIDANRVHASVNMASPEHNAYMIYTSGSTGLPKGVVIQHKALHMFVIWQASLENIDQNSICALYHSFSFDASLADAIPPLFVGATLHIISSKMRFDLEALYKYFCEYKVDAIDLPTQLGMELLSRYSELPLKRVILGGEKVLPPPKTNVKILNTYGPTEFTVAVTGYELKGDESNIPIGRPAPNSACYIVDKYGNLLPRGIGGELCLSGVQCAKGYWQREDLTAEKFVECSFAKGKTMYRTGDLARWNDDDQLEYLGRIDKQIKLRGFRVELGEVEHQVKSYVSILSAIVEVRKIGGVEHLCAYYTADTVVDKDKLKAYLSESLAEYMLPSAYMQLDAMPLTPNGKIDVKALPLPAIERTNVYEPPVGPLEIAICAIFSEVLQLENVGATDNFFELGGTSLSVTRLLGLASKHEIHANKEQGGEELSYTNIFASPTPRLLAQILNGNSTVQSDNKALWSAHDDDYDYSSINEVLAENSIPALHSEDSRPLGNVLFTGATGFLGITLLYQFLRKEQGRAYCLLRKGNFDSVKERLASLLYFYFEESFDTLIGTRIIPIEGDVTEDAWSSCIAEESIDTVFNCAANVRHFAHDNSIERVNIGGADRCIAFCKKKQARLIHVSTISVGGFSIDGDPSPSRVFDEQSLYFGQHLENQYIHSKFIAERNVLSASTQGLDAKIMRVGNLMGRASDGEFQINAKSNSFVGHLRALSILGHVPFALADQPIDLSPVDAVAEAILLLSTTPKSCRIFHPVNNHAYFLGDLIDSMIDMDIPMQWGEQEAFDAAFALAQERMSTIEDMVSLVAYQNMSQGHTVVDIPSSCHHTVQILKRLGWQWPILGKEYQEKFLHALQGLGYFDNDML